MAIFDGIDAIIFDFGGVILDIDYGLTTSALTKLFRQGAEFGQKSQGELFDQIEVGAISPAEFRRFLRQLCVDPETDDKTLDSAWNALLGKIPKERLELLEKIKSRFEIYLLSNTNQIHKDAVDQEMIESAGSVANFENIFEKVYFSHQVGLRKPNPAIFNLVLDQNNLNPETTLFIDDSLQHIEAANQLGLKTHHLQQDLISFWRLNDA